MQTGEVITQEEMEALWTDLQQIMKPSWLTSVPAQYGSSDGQGKLKADQWRTLGTVFFPLTLIWLWSGPETSRHRRDLLEVTMHLVSAIIIATSHEVSGNHADMYLHHMKEYRTGLKNLFPGYRSRPNHHMALHLAEHLRMYGPVHGWWTYPFERTIGMLQRISTNYKPGIDLHLY